MSRRFPRWLARAPIALFKLGLGDLLGHRIVMLEHRGRRTGNLRYVVLEIAERRPGALTVVSGYGGQAQWFKNIQVNSAVRVWNGEIRNTRAKATALSAEESRRFLLQYQRDHPAATAMLAKVLALPLPATGRTGSVDQDSTPVVVRIDLVDAGLKR
ncbi:nitroreductase family deazaflavin-dependent oxidoreductase [Kribbella deserti]|uniref:Nitroreductase family deazaflavin-dependent oxidoreductase n=1 Tax=Kribbella deserti TaxID=1926257 RepID=A0ABV6QF97_9ACTN